MQTGLPDPHDELREQVAALREEVAALRQAVVSLKRDRFGYDLQNPYRR